MKISFCTTCKDRAEHLKDTLMQNLQDNPDMEGLEVEFVVLNYNSGDDLDDWMMSDPVIQDEIKNGRIVYAKTEDPENFHMAHAKNMAHRLATGDVICNVDADNFTGKGFANALKRIFEEDMDVCVHPSHKVSRYFPPEERGFFGRLAMSRKNFERLGGYDEAYEFWGGEDTDLARRARLLGLKYLRYSQPEFLHSIPHTNELRAAGYSKTEEDIKVHAERIHNLMHQGLAPRLLRAAFERLNTLAIKPVTANAGFKFGLGNIIRIDRDLSPIPEIIKPPKGVLADKFSLSVKIPAWYEIARSRVVPRYVTLIP